MMLQTLTVVGDRLMQQSRTTSRPSVLSAEDETSFGNTTPLIRLPLLVSQLFVVVQTLNSATTAEFSGGHTFAAMHRGPQPFGHPPVSAVVIV